MDFFLINFFLFCKFLIALYLVYKNVQRPGCVESDIWLNDFEAEDNLKIRK